VAEGLERWRRVWNFGAESETAAQSLDRRRRAWTGGADLRPVAQGLECCRRVSGTVFSLIFLKNFRIGQYKEFLGTDGSR